ncbi:MAG: hypothetical protein QG553_257 [Patescibacteria group bacterium]|nr:hypothetical protein [Patescibacteria group bacterium]
MTTLEEPPSGPEFPEPLLAPQGYLALDDCQLGRIYHAADADNDRFGYLTVNTHEVPVFTTVHLRGAEVITHQEYHADIAGSFRPSRAVEVDLDGLDETSVLVLLAVCGLHTARQRLRELEATGNGWQTPDEALTYEEAAMRVNYYERLLSGLTEAD